MKHRARTLIATVILVVGGPHANIAAEMSSPAPAENLVITQLTVIGASDEERTKLDDALDRFEAAGLELPPLVIEFADNNEPCLGHAGYHWPAGADDPTHTSRIAICHQLPLYIFHELAHAWDHHNLTDDTRQSFLDRWGLDGWNDRDDDWHDRGTERAADTIAYALSWSSPTDNPDILQYVCGYELLTGNPLPNPDLVSCP